MEILHSAVAILAAILLIIRFKVDPVISLLLACIYLGLATGRAPRARSGRSPADMAEVGLLIGFGVLPGLLDGRVRPRPGRRRRGGPPARRDRGRAGGRADGAPVPGRAAAADPGALVLFAAGAIAGLAEVSDPVLTFLGDANIALFIGLLTAFGMVRPDCSAPSSPRAAWRSGSPTCSPPRRAPR